MIRKYILGVFDTEENVLRAASALRENRIPIQDVLTPYPIHALEKIIGIKQSWLPVVCFLAGLIGCIGAIGFQIWAASIDWPINVGGKPFNSVPAFVPITFEITVLIAGITTAIAFFFRSKLFPLKRIELHNSKVSDDRFVIVIENPSGERKLSELMKIHGAVMVETREERE